MFSIKEKEEKDIVFIYELVIILCRNRCINIEL